MFLLDEIFSSELRSRVALADVFLKLECLVQSKDDLEKGDHVKFQRREQVESENEHQRHTSYLSFFFTRAKFLENKIYTEKTRKLRQNTQ